MSLQTIFIEVLNMSLTAGIIIIFILLARLFLKKLPKIYSYVLWAIVLFRLLCPVSISSPVSFLGILDAPVTENTAITSSITYIPSDITTNVLEKPIPRSEEKSLTNITESLSLESAENFAAINGTDTIPSENKSTVKSILPYIWTSGMLAMFIYSGISYYMLRGKLVGSLHLRENIYIADHISSPFVMGIFHPRIYLTSAVSSAEQEYIILHEQHHIHRLDHLWKALAFLALSIHWFNPLIWLAFVLSSKDMEMSCDEAVIRKMGEDIRADYSASLLSLASNQPIILGMPLAFVEVDAKGRIQNLANRKKTTFAVILAAVIVCVVLAVCLLTNPSTEQNDPLNGVSDASKPVEWFDFTKDTSDIDQTFSMELSEFPGITFHYIYDQIIASQNSGETILSDYEILISGNPVWNAYFCDRTGDGIPDLCVTYSAESDLKDQRIVVYDYKNGATYSRMDQGIYDFCLSMQDDQLLVTKKIYNTGEIAETGYLVFEDDMIQIVPLDGKADRLPVLVPEHVENVMVEQALGTLSFTQQLNEEETTAISAWASQMELRKVTFADGNSPFAVQGGNMNYFIFNHGESGFYYTESQIPNSDKFESYIYTNNDFYQVLNPSLAPFESKYFGIRMLSENVTPTGLTLNIFQSEGDVTGELQFGSDYTLKVFDKDLTNHNELYGKNSWKAVPYITDHIGWEDIAYELPKDGNVQLTINWESVYGSLPPGYYLLSKQFNDFRGAGDYDTGIYYAFFTIEEEN